MKKDARYLLLAGVALLLGACGGGDGEGDRLVPVSPASVTTTFPVAKALANILNKAETRAFSISGTEGTAKVAGSGTATFGALESRPFEGATMLAKTNTVTGTKTITGKADVVFADSSTTFVDTNYRPRGFIGAGKYAVVVGPVSIPETAGVKSSGAMYEYEVYPDIELSERLSTVRIEYSLEQETASTALLKIVRLETNAGASSVSRTITESYSVTAVGDVKRLSEHDKTSAGSVTRTFLF